MPVKFFEYLENGIANGEFTKITDKQQTNITQTTDEESASIAASLSTGRFTQRRGNKK